MPTPVVDSSTQLYYQPRNRAKSIEPTKSPCHKWEVTPRKYYDTLNIVVVLKSRLGFDARIWISIVIFDREGRPSMRLRRRPFQIREPLRSVSQVIGSHRFSRHKAKHNEQIVQPNQDAELFAIDNILNQADYQGAVSHASSNGLRIGRVLKF